jgi:NAD(P)-dependent dehydrogenase (short-subunit alcohol dehydrogenase family)
VQPHGKHFVDHRLLEHALPPRYPTSGSLRARAELGAAKAFGGDVRCPADIAPWVQSAISGFGRIDVLINNAGVYPRQAFLGMSEAQWDEIQEINMQRRLMPLDIARVCLFLSSELSDGMTGQSLNVDGGWVMY